MADTSVEVRGLKELIERMQRFPDKLSQVLDVGMKASLLALWENVPPYPAPPADSTYRRTGTLGRTLGASIGGGQAGKPEIYETKKLGGGHMEGRFGTRLDYAPHVIGNNTQAWMHKGHWWMIKTIAQKAKVKIENIWRGIGNKLAAYLDGKAG